MPNPPQHRTPPGRLVNIGTHHLHLRCAGDGKPSVVFDAALGGSSLSWTLVQPSVAQFTRACVYDRAGFGWSEAGPLPRTAGRIADELFELLHRGDVTPPYVLVGHSFGALVMQLVAARHREDVAALLLIEPAIVEEWVEPAETQRSQIVRGTRLCRYGGMAARSGVAGVVSTLVGVGALAPARALVRVVSRGGLRREDEGVLAPIWRLPPEVRSVLRHMWTRPKFFEALGSQIEHICESASQVLAETRDGFGDLPLTVMTAERAHPDRLHADAALAARSTRGRHILVPETGHWIPLDAPQSVIDEIKAMVSQVRESAVTE